MAPRVFLLSILFTVGLLAGQSIGAARLDTTLGFSRQPQDVVAVRSRALTLECEVSSTLPEYNVSWTHDGRPLQLTSDSRRQLLANGSLYFKRVQHKRAGAHDTSDQGEYRCVARNAVGALVSQPAQVRVAVLGNNFNEFPSNTTAKAGDVVRFTCQIDSVPKALITWERNREPLPHNSRMFILDSGDLYMLDIQSTDEGTYRCMATNVINKKQRFSPEISLKVVARSQGDSPQVLQFLNPHISTVQLHQGQTLLLPCAVVGSLSPEITWTFESPNSSDRVLNHTLAALSILTLHNVSLENAGNYTCSATASNRETITQVVEVDVWVPPYFKANGTPISESHPAAKTVRFKCDAQGIPKPEIMWFKDAERLEINGRFKQRASELVLLNAVTTDSGLYQCVVHSKAGEIWAVGRLQVNASRAMPDPPHSPSCITLSASQIQLSWEPPQRLTGDKIVAYSIHFVPTEGGDERQEVKVNRTFIVDKLAAYTNYTFYVRAYNGKSASDPSTRIVCQTGEGVPQAAPSFDVDLTSSSTARVAWKTLPSEKARGPITEYKIQWRRLGHPSSNLEEVKGDVMEYTITGLQPGQTYEIRVLAATKKGWPDLTDDQLLWKNVDMPSVGPQNVPKAPLVNLSAVNSTCIEVSWSVPVENQYPASNFKLFYRKQTSQQIGPILLPANMTHYVLEGLEPQTLYEIHIVGVGASGDGEVGVQSIHTRPDSSLQFLEPPGNLQAEPTSSTTINLTWTPPFSVLDVAYYNVSYSSGVSRIGSENIVQYIHTSGTGVEIGGLKPFTLYEFKVCTHDHHNKHGPYSQKLECRTMEDIPSVVRDVQCKAWNSSSMRVTWKEPTQTNGIISGYAVLYTEDAALPIDKWKEKKVPGNRVSTEVIALEPKTRYFLSLRAATQAGWGPPSGLPQSGICNTPALTDERIEGTTVNTLHSTQHLGIVVGLTIAVGCIVICMVAMVWRRQCVRRMPAAQAESGVQHVNGNGYYRDWERPQEAELRELELHLATMAPNIPPANHNLLDTKGGYPNGQVNGLKHSFLSNGRIPNGHGNRSKCSVHITENPQVRPSNKYSNTQGQLSLQESKVDDDDDRAMPDQKVPLLRNSQHSTNVRGEDHTELEEDFDHDMSGEGPDIADSTQLTDLDVSLNGNNSAGTSSHNRNRNGNSDSSISSGRNRGCSSSTDCVVSIPSHLSLPQ